MIKMEEPTVIGIPPTPKYPNGTETTGLMEETETPVAPDAPETPETPEEKDDMTEPSETV